MSYRDPLDAARARIAALEDLLDSQRFGLDAERDGGDGGLREARLALAEERAAHQAELARARDEVAGLERQLDETTADLTAERARRQAEVSLLRTKLEETERALSNNRGLFEAEQTMQRAEAEAESARLRQQLVVYETTIRELREELRVHLRSDARELRAHYEARVRAVGAELAEQGTLSRRLAKTLEDAEGALDALPPVDVRDREGIVERELARRKVAIGEAEQRRVTARIERLEQELERITAAEAELAKRR